MKGNIYIPERTNIRCGRGFFNEFLYINYDEVDEHLSTLSESSEVVQMFDTLYRKVTQQQLL